MTTQDSKRRRRSSKKQKASAREFNRRHFFKQSAAAGVLAGLPASFWASCAEKIQQVITPNGVSHWEGRAVNVRTHHFDLSHLPNHDTFHFHMAGRVHALVAHDEASYAKHAQDNHVMRVKSDAATHYIEDIDFLADCPVSWHVRATGPEGAMPVMALSGIHIPPQAIAKAGEMLGDPDFALGHTIYDFLEIEKPTPADKADATATVSQDPTHMATWVDCAKSLIYHHKDILCLKGEHAAIAMSLIESRPDLLIPVAMKCQQLGEAQGVDSNEVGWINGVEAPNTWLTADQEGNPITNTNYTWIPNSALKDVTDTAVIHIRDLVLNHPHMKDVKYTITDGSHSNVSVPPPAETKADDSGTGYSYKLQGGGSFRGSYLVRMTDQDTTNGVVTLAFESHAPLYLTTALQFYDANGKKLDNDAPGGYNEKVSQITQTGAAYEDKAAAFSGYLVDDGRGGNTNNHILVGKLDPADTILGIPVNLAGGSQNWWPHFETQVPIPAGATKAKVLLVGPSQKSGSEGYDNNLYLYFDPDPNMPDADKRIALINAYPFAYTLPVYLTAIVQVAVPTLLLGMGIAGYEKVKGLKYIFKDIAEGLIIGVVEQTMAKNLADESYGAADFAIALVHECMYLGGALLARQIAEALGVELAEEAAPFIGLVLFAADVADTIANIASVAAFEMQREAVESWELTLSQNLQVTVKHDPLDYEYPAAATKMEVVLHYENDTSKIRTFKLNGQNRIGQDASGNDLPEEPISAPIVFKEQIIGGQVTATTTFLSESDWVVGYAAQSVANRKAADWTSGPEVQIELELKELLIPLVSDTTYSHKLLLKTENNEYAWEVTKQSPTSTINPQGDSESTAGPIVTSFNGLTFSQKTGQVGQSFKSRSAGIKDKDGSENLVLSQVQNFNLNVDKGNGAPGETFSSSDVGHKQNSFILYDLLGLGADDPATNTQAKNFLLVPDANGKMHLRKMGDIEKKQTFVTDPTSADFKTQHPSYGHFQSPDIISACIDHSGMVAAVTKSNRLEVLRPKLDPDERNGSIVAASVGTKPGSLDDVKAVAAINKPASNARFMVVEQGTQNGVPKLQALSWSGNPVSEYFGPGDDGDTSHWYSFPSTATTGATPNGCAVKLRVDSGDAQEVLTYLDISVESQGYIYVLSHIGNGETDSDYRLDIYKPNGVFLVQQQGLRAAAIAVDAFRNLFTQNHQALTINGQTAPSISQYIPSTPVPTQIEFNDSTPITQTEPGLAVQSTIEFTVASASGLENVVVQVTQDPSGDGQDESEPLAAGDSWSYPLMKAGTYVFSRKGIADAITVIAN